MGKPASIVADTINVFSCGYPQGMASDCKTFNMDADVPWTAGIIRPKDESSTSKGFGFGPTASGPAGYADIINAALLAGTDRTWCPTIHSGLFCDGSGSQPWYGGGLENYIRFHESWVGTQFYYQGSFVAVGTPQHTCWAYQTQWTVVANDLTYSCAAHGGTPPQGAPPR